MIETDASDYAIATILSITLSNSKLHPVAFLSQTLTGAELNYNTHNKELLAIFEAFKSWHHYLEGAANLINIVTDHKNLEHWDVYSKEGDTGYVSVNPQNLQLIFTEEQLISSLRATYLEEPILQASVLMDIKKLHSDI
uniref:Reverse transcriptase RNase H-like domain-containing protein n=1 Tax=Moniliophthora roreri TaxID=221103 RepID=A0A0W0FHF7_MONRR